MKSTKEEKKNKYYCSFGMDFVGMFSSTKKYIGVEFMKYFEDGKKIEEVQRLLEKRYNQMDAKEIKKQLDNRDLSALPYSPLFLVDDLRDDLEMIKLLLRLNSSTNCENQEKMSYPTVLFPFLEKNPSIEILKLLIENKSLLDNKYSKQGNPIYAITPLQFALSEENPSLEIIKLLVENKSDLNSKFLLHENQPNSMNALELMCNSENPSFEIIKLLVENKSDIDVQIKDNLSLLHFVSSLKDTTTDFIDLLLERKCDLNFQSSRDHSSPLHHAIMRGSLSIVEHLVEKKADMNLKDNDGNAPLVHLDLNYDLLKEFREKYSISDLKVKNVEQVFQEISKKSSKKSSFWF